MELKPDLSPGRASGIFFMQRRLRGFREPKTIEILIIFIEGSERELTKKIKIWGWNWNSELELTKKWNFGVEIEIQVIYIDGLKPELPLKKWNFGVEIEIFIIYIDGLEPEPA